jgi:hypothetical protein
MRIPVILAALALGAAGALGCSADPPIHDAKGPTFHRDIEPLLQRSCLTCHGEPGVAPVLFDAYGKVAQLSGVIAQKTEARQMPPWGAVPTDECAPPRPFLDDIHLSGEDIATFAAWHAAGAPKGDPADGPPPWAHRPSGIDADLELSADTPFDPGDEEAYRCFVLDPELDADTYVGAMQVVPGNTEIVHHALAFIDPQRASLELADEAGGYSCFGGPGFSDTALLTGWAPGTDPLELPDDIGIMIPAGALVVLQIHYHPGRAGGSDTTALRLRLRDDKPSRRLENVLIGNFDGPFPGGDGLLPGTNDREDTIEFRVPALAEGHTERMRYTLEFPIPSIQLYGVGAHLHRVGVDAKIDVLRGGDERACLLHVPQWDFDWQRIYRYQPTGGEYPEIFSGDAVEVRCTYDNTLNNPALAAQLDEERLSHPIDVQLGESTLDEMCIGFFGFIYPSF